MKTRFGKIVLTLSVVCCLLCAGCGGESTETQKTDVATVDAGPDVSTPAPDSTVVPNDVQPADVGRNPTKCLQRCAVGNFSTAPTCNHNRSTGVFSCHNNIIRVRTAQYITWFDVCHQKEQCWYVAKNNLNINVVASDGEWQSSEIDKIAPQPELQSVTPDQALVKFRYDFPNGVKVYTTMTMKPGMQLRDVQCAPRRGVERDPRFPMAHHLWPGRGRRAARFRRTSDRRGRPAGAV